MKQLLQCLVLTFLSTTFVQAGMINDTQAFVLLEGGSVNIIGPLANIGEAGGGMHTTKMVGGFVNRMSGGDINFSMFGGSINDLSLSEISSVDLRRGSIRRLRFGGDDNILTMSGGLIDEVLAANISRITQTFGEINTIFGGLGGEFRALGGRVNKVSGFMHGTIYLRTGMLTDLSDLDPTAVVIYVSEPPVLGGLLAGLALLAWRRRVSMHMSH